MSEPTGVSDAPAAPERPSLLQLRDARRLLVATFVSFGGAAMASVAIAFVAYQRSESLVLTVLVLMARALPALFLAPLVGRLTRYDPRILGAIGQAANLVLALALAALAAFGDLDYGLLLAYSLVNGVICALIAPTIPTYNRMVVPDDRLAEFTALWSGVASVASIPGALAGGVVVAVVGAEWTFLAYAVSYVPLIAVILLLPKPQRDPAAEQQQTLRQGVETVRRVATLRRALGLGAILNLVAWPVLSALPALAHEIEPEAHILGYLTGAFYAGSALVTLVVVRLRRHYRFGTVLFTGFLGTGIVLLIQTTLTHWRDPGFEAVVIATVMLVPIGLAVSMNAVLLQSLVQLGSPPNTEGPVLVVYGTVTTILAPLGGLLLGAFVDVFSTYWALTGCGVVMVVAAVLLRGQFAVFDTIGPARVPAARSHGHHGALAHLLGPEHVHRALAHLSVHHRRVAPGDVEPTLPPPSAPPA